MTNHPVWLTRSANALEPSTTEDFAVPGCSLRYNVPLQNACAQSICTRTADLLTYNESEISPAKGTEFWGCVVVVGDPVGLVVVVAPAGDVVVVTGGELVDVVGLVVVVGGGTVVVVVGGGGMGAPRLLTQPPELAFAE